MPPLSAIYTYFGAPALIGGLVGYFFISQIPAVKEKIDSPWAVAFITGLAVWLVIVAILVLTG